MRNSSFSNIIGFHHPDEEYGCFSNWYMSPFLYGGREYNCVEQYMMVQKVCLGRRFDRQERLRFRAMDRHLLSGCMLFYVIIPVLQWLRKKIGEKAFSCIFVVLGVIIMIDIAYDDIAGYMFGMPNASQLYSRLGWFSSIP